MNREQQRAYHAKRKQASNHTYTRHGKNDGHDFDNGSSFQWHKHDSSDLLRTDQPERKANGKLSTEYGVNYSKLSKNAQDKVGRADYRN